MAHLFFAASIQRHIPLPERDVAAGTVDEALAAVFADEPRLRGYILDDQGGLRRHLAVYVDGRPVRDRRHLLTSDKLRVREFRELAAAYDPAGWVLDHVGVR